MVIQIIDINIKLKEERQLFNNFDPAPFLERDLDDEAVEYIVDSVKEYPLKRKMRLVIFLPKERKYKISDKMIKSAINMFFDYQVDVKKKRLKNLFAQGRTSLIIGILFLTFCLTSSEFISIYRTGIISRIFAEGLTIVGWVSMWNPINLFLYEWWPITREMIIRQKIKDMVVKIKEY